MLEVQCTAGTIQNIQDTTNIYLSACQIPFFFFKIINSSKIMFENMLSVLVLEGLSLQVPGLTHLDQYLVEDHALILGQEDLLGEFP